MWRNQCCLRGQISRFLDAETQIGWDNLCLLKYGANPCPTKHDGNTPLHKLLVWQKMGIVVILLTKAGADIDATKESDSSVPLITAAKSQHLNISVFIDHGADPDRQDSGGNTALHHIRKS